MRSLCFLAKISFFLKSFDSANIVNSLNSVYTFQIILYFMPCSFLCGNGVQSEVLLFASQHVASWRGFGSNQSNKTKHVLAHYKSMRLEKCCEIIIVSGTTTTKNPIIR